MTEAEKIVQAAVAKHWNDESGDRQLLAESVAEEAVKLTAAGVLDFIGSIRTGATWPQIRESVAAEYGASSDTEH